MGEFTNLEGKKPFWSYVNSKQQDNVGVSPMDENGQLISDTKSKNLSSVKPIQVRIHC